MFSYKLISKRVDIPDEQKKFITFSFVDGFWKFKMFWRAESQIHVKM